MFDLHKRIKEFLKKKKGRKRVMRVMDFGGTLFYTTVASSPGYEVDICIYKL